MIKFEWANDNQNVLFWRFTAPWTWEEFYDAQKQVHAVIESSTGIVDSIFVLTKEQRIPLGAITHFSNIAKRKHSRHDMIILLGGNPFLMALMRALARVSPSFSNHLRFAGSKAEAYSMIAAARQKRAESRPEQEPVTSA